MKPAGKVTAKLGRKLLIAETDAGQLPPLYTIVTDENSRPIGKIVDLYGSVSHPYLTVLCNDDKTQYTEAGSILYAVSQTKEQKQRRKFRRTYKKG